MLRTWNVSLPARIFGVVSVIAGVLMFVAVIITVVGYGEPVDGAQLGALALGSLFIIAPLLATLRPRVTLTDTELIVRNPMRTYQVALADVASVDNGYSGLVVVLRDDTKLQVWAVQKSNLARLLNRQTRSDEVAAAIRTQAQAVRQKPGRRTGSAK
ncbi:hypothetical protein Cs7R123_47250 [Catellatospora sp. TT07R-123]|uniref:PH domain-containing protein n=1 Tax=Catellatospora sp. TT07R-123 TaxID=2733863 RepID=UPI001B0D9765|nr:PH domain-containing protein [Catellatospora sp. TT07R-123]GHJ47383.1 hypothetical protein Cs7R123_47250 [Catellatospora sp. TT07R-123]